MAKTELDYIDSLTKVLDVYVNQANNITDRLDRIEQRMIRAGMIGPLPKPKEQVVWEIEK